VGLDAIFADYSSTHERKSRTSIVVKHGKFFLKHNNVSEDLPLAIVFRALGMATDQEVMQLISIGDRDMEALFVPSLEACRLAAVQTQDQALK
jgi:DNA-directed RNA polymerase III subunit RPC2